MYGMRIKLCFSKTEFNFILLTLRSWRFRVVTISVLQIKGSIETLQTEAK